MHALCRCREVKGSPLEFRLRKWLWTVLMAACMALYLWARPFWNAVSIIYITFASNYAMVATYASAEQAAEAKVRADSQQAPEASA